MEIKQIEERIEKKQAQIAKIEKRIAKWTKAKSDEGFKKEYSWHCQDGFYYNYETRAYDVPYEQFKAKRWEDYIKNCDREIRCADSDLADAALTLQKYNNALKLEQAKQDKLNAPKIQVIVEFLETWKLKVADYTRKNAEFMVKYYELEHLSCDIHNNKWLRVKEGADPKEIDLQYKEVNKAAKSAYAKVAPLTRQVFDRRSETLIDELELKKVLDKEADNLYLDLIERVTKITGEIEDARGLHIGYKGDLEGIIRGQGGTAKIETIGAGGYNNDIILDSGRHGQCYHFRTLVHKMA